ncbi:hypothetical protein AC578_9518 [Pseudocercospora eumusae]|uniref:Amino acid permease/ SLC12A domain-containing protein n=1 Tax=Pseudocercospora eumusae TaxID=321146 RepID=A0A139HG09_9PEZI|nr:hypothetical protein AC578_9518 [Pseudocercospora eumusae]
MAYMQGDVEVVNKQWNMPADPADLKLPAVETSKSTEEDWQDPPERVKTEYRDVKRGLKERHVQFIAIGGTIGTGLFLGIGRHLAQSGPLSTFLGYIFTGCAIWGMMQCLGEMVTWLPLPGAIPQLGARYVDEAVGFAVGWNNWYNMGITTAAEFSAAATLISYWNDTISPAVWISIFIVVILALNVFAVSIYGEAEFIFASIKIVTMVGLLILAFIIDLGGGPNGDRLGFRYWKSPYSAMAEYIGTGDAGRFAGLFAGFIGAAFSYGGSEYVAVAAGESRNPRKTIPQAVRRVFWRILFFYALGSLAVGVLVPHTDPNLTEKSGAEASPWVIGIQRAGISALPSIINAVIITSATSAGNACVYIGSRYLYALAQLGQAPQMLLWCTKSGVPLWCVLSTASFSLLAYMSVSSGSANVFGWLTNISALASLLTWSTVITAYLRFYRATQVQGIDRGEMAFRAVGTIDTAYASLAFFVIVILGNGFAVFTKGNWNTKDFIIAYIGIPIYAVLILGWKLVKRTRFIRSHEVDLMSGKAEIDRQEHLWAADEPRNAWEKVWAKVF